MALTTEQLVKVLGFESFQEFLKLVSNVDLASDDKLKKFKNWKMNDGTKKGLMELNTL